MALTDAEKSKLKRHSLSGLNKPKRTPQHPTKKGIVAIRDGDKVRIIRFGDQNMGHNYSSEEIMVKKISKWVVVIPIKIVEWAIWPIAKVHELLKRLAIWLNKKLS